MDHVSAQDRVALPDERLVPGGLGVDCRLRLRHLRGRGRATRALEELARLARAAADQVREPARPEHDRQAVGAAHLDQLCGALDLDAAPRAHLHVPRVRMRMGAPSLI